MKFHIWKSEINKQWYFQLRARNGKIVMQSEGYHRKASAFKTVAAIKKAALVLVAPK